MLPSELRGRFERSLGHDLGGVRVHTNAAAAEAAEAHRARAFTTGQDIFFGPGQYDPQTRAGQELIAHEVAHTVQQRGGTAVQAKRDVSGPGDASEVEADMAAKSMLAGEPVAITEAPSAEIQREPKDKADGGSGLKIKKKPRWTGKSCTFTAFGKDTTISYDDGVTAKVNLGSAKIDMMKPLKKRIDVPFAGVPGGIYLTASAEADASVAAGGQFTVKKIDYPGPWADDVEPEGLLIEASGSARLEFKVKGTVGFGGFVGASFMNISAGGEVSLTAAAGMDLKLAGGGAVNPMGDVNGLASMTVNADAKIVGSGGITIDYMALIDSGNIFTQELFSKDIATAQVIAVAGSHLSEGGGPVIPSTTTTKFEWMDWPDPGPYDATFLRPPNAAERKRMEDEKAGAEGSGPVGPDDMVEDDCDNPENDGAGGHYTDKCPPEEMPPSNDGSGGAGPGEDPYGPPPDNSNASGKGGAKGSGNQGGGGGAGGAGA